MADPIQAPQGPVVTPTETDPSSSQYSLTLSPTFNLGITDEGKFPVSVLLPLEGHADWNVSDDVTVSADAAVFANYANTQSGYTIAGETPPLTLLRGVEDRYTFFMTRNPLSTAMDKPPVGIKRLGAAVTFNKFPAGPLTLHLAAFKPIEDILYPYAHNGFNGFPTLQNAVFDTSAGGDVYNLLIGPVLAAVWTPVSTDENTLEVAAQVATAGETSFDFSTWMESAQLKYTHSWGDKEGGDSYPNSLTAALYVTNKSPTSSTTATGEEISDTLGVGGALILNIPGFTLNAGYSTNGNEIRGEGVSINSRYHGFNLSAHVDCGPIALAAGFSLLNFSEDTTAYGSSSESTTENAADLKILLPITPDFGLTAGYRNVFINKKTNLDPKGQDIHEFSLSLNYNWNIL